MRSTKLPKFRNGRIQCSRGVGGIGPPSPQLTVRRSTTRPPHPMVCLVYVVQVTHFLTPHKYHAQGWELISSIITFPDFSLKCALVLFGEVYYLNKKSVAPRFRLSSNLMGVFVYFVNLFRGE